MTTVPAAPATPLHRTRTVPAIVAVAAFMQMLDGTIIATLLPAMAADFGTDVVTLNVAFTAYLLATAVFIAPAGWLADRYGARRVFLAAIVLFTLASAACGLAGSLAAFTAARIVQGAAGALMTPVGRQLVLAGVPKSEIVHAIAIITWPALIAPVLGPLAGAFIAAHAGWEWAFFINLPLGAAGSLLVFLFVPRDGGGARRPFDTPGFVLTAGALSATLAGLEFAGAEGPTPAALGLLVAGPLLGLLGLRHLRRRRHPLLDLAVLRVPTFAFATLAAGTAGRIAVNATPFLLPLLFQVGLGYDAVEAGAFVLVYFLGNLLMKSVTTPALRRFGFRTLLVGNGCVSAVVIAAFALVDGATPVPLVAALLLVCGLSRSMQFTALATLSFADVPSAQRSAATTIAAILQQLSQLLGVALAAVVVRLVSEVLPGSGAGGETDLLPAIRAAFATIALVGLVSAVRFLALAPDAGAEVSGHRR